MKKSSEWAVQTSHGRGRQAIHDRERQDRSVATFGAQELWGALIHGMNSMAFDTLAPSGLLAGLGMSAVLAPSP